MRFGKKGVERSLEDDLRGRAGAVQVEVNAVGRVVRELDRTEGQPGSTRCSPSISTCSASPPSGWPSTRAARSW